MLSKKERLSRDAFNRFFSTGKRLRSDSFDLIYTPHPTFHGAVVISKKVASRAVARNRMRRRVYSLLQEQKAQGVWIVIMRKTPHLPSRATLKDELARLNRKLIPD
jgi:ribonuclease P protein component